MKPSWEESAWDDYCYWQTQDKKTLKRISNTLIKDIQRSPFSGVVETGAVETKPQQLVEPPYRRRKQDCLQGGGRQYYYRFLQGSL